MTLQAFERFTERARQVVVLAQDEARSIKVNYVGSEHILLGLLREEEGLAAHVLGRLGVPFEQTKGAVVGETRGPEVETQGQIPFTPRARKIFDLSLREAFSLGHNYIGTEHILLGLVRDGGGPAMKILKQDFGLDAEKIRNEVILALPKRGIEPKVEATREQRVVEISATLEELKKSQWLLEILNATAMLARQYPDRPTRAIARAARELHS